MKASAAALAKDLAELIGSPNVSVAEPDLAQHAVDRSFNPPSVPMIVVWPRNTEQVSQVLQYANRTTTPVTGYGGGTSLEGNPIPLGGGIVLDMTRMNKIIKVLPSDYQVVVQPGILGDALNEALAEQNLFFPAVPGSSHIATVGGMIANNAGGMHTIKYGVAGDWVKKLKVVLASGEIVHIGSRSMKSAAGYDLKRLMVGSEGTLGIITETTLRLINRPKHRLTMMMAFDTLTDATDTTVAIMAAAIDAAALEFMEKDYIRLVNATGQFNWYEGPTLIIELHGDREKFAADVEQLNAIGARHHQVSLTVAETEADRTKVWAGRRAARTNLSHLLPGRAVATGDVGVPLSAIPGYIKKVKAVAAVHGIDTYVFGHAGDGNLHVWQVYDQADPDSVRRAYEVNRALILHAIELEGTCAGEHGIGINKRQYLAIEHASSLELMKNIKKTFDPKGILNPGKLFLDQ